MTRRIRGRVGRGIEVGWRAWARGAALLVALSPALLAQDPRLAAPGYVAPKVPDHGPDRPYAAVVVELAGAATELLAEGASGELFRVEVPRGRTSRRLRRLHGFQLEPGRYRWVGYRRWERRFGARLDLYEHREPSRWFEVRAGRATYAGRIMTRLRPRRRVHAATRRGGVVEVHPADFDASLEVEDASGQELAALAGRIGWLRRAGLDLRSGLVPAPPPPLAAPAPPGGGWGRRILGTGAQAGR